MQQRRLKIPMLTKAYRKYRMNKMKFVPAEVCIETTSSCNLTCKMCPRKDMKRPKKAMQFNLFKKIVDDCVELGVKCIKPHNYGEPLMTPSFPDYITYIREKSKNIKIILVTNGQLLTEKITELLIKEKVDVVHLSIDGACRETYEQIRKGGNYEKVIANANKLIRKKNESRTILPVVTIGLVKMKQSEEEIKKFHEIWQGKADRVIINEYSTRAGAMEGFENASKKFRTPCFRLWKQLVICSNGQVSLCCADWDCRIIVGDMNTESIKDIWHGEKLNHIRDLHKAGKAKEVSLCSVCNPETWDPMPIWWY